MLRSYNQSAKAFVLENFENLHVQAFILGWALAPTDSSGSAGNWADVLHHDTGDSFLW